MRAMQKAKAEMGYTDVWVRVKSVMGGKVDKQHGKGLSSNDFTDEDKMKVDNLSTITNSQIDELFRKE